MPNDYIDRRCKHSDRCERKRHYVVMARCQNCAWEGYMWVTEGHTKLDAARRAECPRCECRDIKPGKYVDV
jgi:hypothetical protein